MQSYLDEIADPQEKEEYEALRLALDYKSYLINPKDRTSNQVRASGSREH